MTTFLLIAALVISITLNVLTFIIIKIQINKVHTYEQWVLNFQQVVTQTLARMREMDKGNIFATHVGPEGAFESDDQIGVVFKEMEDLIEELNARIQ